MLTYIPFLVLTIAGLLCLRFVLNISDFSPRQKRVLVAGGSICTLLSFGLLYELRAAEHWLPTTLYIIIAYAGFWWFTNCVYYVTSLFFTFDIYLRRGPISNREAALVILWGQAMFPLLMVVALIW